MANALKFAHTSVSHELKTPLKTISILSKNMIKKTLKRSVRENLKVIQFSADIL